MRSFSSLKCIYKFIERGEKLEKKFKYKWWQYIIAHNDFEYKILYYQGVRKKERVISILRYDRLNRYEKPIQVCLEKVLENWYSDRLLLEFVEWFWPIQSKVLSSKKIILWKNSCLSFLFPSVRTLFFLK